MKHFWAAIAFLLLSVWTAGAQDSATAEAKAPRRLLLVVTRDAEGSLSANDLLLLSRSVQMQVQKATDEIIVVESSEIVTDASAPQLNEAAKRVGADSWLWVIAGGGWSTLKLAVQSFDLISNDVVLDTTVAREGWQSPLDLALEPWDDIARPIAGHYHKVDIAVAQEGPLLAVLSITALPGTRISGLGGPPLVADESGTASREVPSSRQYTLGASLAGYHFESRQIFLEADKVISFDQKPESRWTVEAALQDRGYPGISLAWSPTPGVFSLKLGITTYLVGLAFDSAGAFSSQPMSEVILQASTYWFAGTSFFRFYTADAFYLRIDHPEGSTPSVDSLSFGGIRGVLGAELMVSPPGSLFFEYAPTVYFGINPDLFKAALGPDKTPPGWVFNPTSAMNLLSFRAGYRWQL
jgi:hypothetical protein